MRERLKAWLIRMQKYTKTDNLYFVRNFSYVGSSQLFTVLDGFLIYVLIAHFVDPALFGQYKYYVSIFDVSAVASLTGMKVALTRSVAKGFEGSLQVAFHKRLTFGYLLGLPLIAGFLWYISHDQTEIALACGLVYLVGPLIYACANYVAFLQGKNDFKTLSLTTIVSEVVLLIGMLIAIFFVHDALIFFCIFLLTFAASGIFYLQATRRVTHQVTDPDFVPHAYHQSRLDVLLTIASRIDSVIVFHYLGAVQVAQYAFAILTADQLRALAAGVYTVAGPKLARHDLQSILKTFNRKLLLMGVLGGCIALVYVLAAPLIYQVFFPRYVDVVGYSQVYALTLIVGLPALLGSYLINLQGLKQETMLYNVTNQALLILLLLAGGKWYGMWGIIIARLISGVLQLMSMIWILRRTKQISNSTL